MVVTLEWTAFQQALAGSRRPGTAWSPELHRKLDLYAGLIAEWGLAWTLPRLVCSAHALDLLLSGRKIDAREAERIGLVNRVLPDEKLLAQSVDYGRELAANSSPSSMMVMKRQVYQQLTRELGPSCDEAVSLMIESFSRPDFREGVQSFLERRPPKFPRV